MTCCPVLPLEGADELNTGGVKSGRLNDRGSVGDSFPAASLPVTDTVKAVPSGGTSPGTGRSKLTVPSVTLRTGMVWLEVKAPLTTTSNSVTPKLSARASWSERVAPGAASVPASGETNATLGGVPSAIGNSKVSSGVDSPLMSVACATTVMGWPGPALAAMTPVRKRSLPSLLDCNGISAAPVAATRKLATPASSVATTRN